MARKEGYDIRINSKQMEFYLDVKLRMTARIDDNCVAYLNGRVLTSEQAHIASTLKLDRELWHRRLGHFHQDGVDILIRHNLVNGLKLDSNAKPDPICAPCIAGKQTRAPHTTPATHAATPLDRVFIDLKGPVNAESMPHHGAFRAFQEFHKLAENQTHQRLVHLRDDKGGEFSGKEFDQYCISAGITRERTIVATPEQNRRVERANRWIAEGTITKLTESNLPPSFWGLAALATVHEFNRARVHNGKTPYEHWHGEPPSVDHLRIFGCLAYVFIPKSQRNALDSHTDKCIFTRKIIHSDSAVFDERVFPGTSFVKESIPNLSDYIHLPDLEETNASPSSIPPQNTHPPTRRWRPKPNFEAPDHILIPIADGVEAALNTSTSREPTTLGEDLKRPDGDNKYKGRIVAKGYAQREGIDYTETFAPTARFGALRTIIALAALEDWELESVDISTAFLNGEIDAEVYMRKPEGVEFEGYEGTSWVLQLLKGLYGIKQGPRIWSVKLHTVLSEIGLKRLESDHSVFIYERDSVKIIVPVHVDDLLLASKSSEAIQMVKDELKARFKIHDQGPTSFLIGVKLERDRQPHTISLSQPVYIEQILETYEMQDCNGTDTPMAEKPLLSTKDSSQTEQENENPGRAHWLALKRVLRYLRTTTKYKLTYGLKPNSDELFTTHSDADLGGNAGNTRSTAGFVMSIGGGAVMWSSRLQRHTSLSSTESEYTTASTTVCEMIWMRSFLDEIGYDIASYPSTLFVDNASAIQVAKNPEHQSTMKHVHRSFNWIRERVANNEICVAHVPGVVNVADIFTKPLGRIKFEQFVKMLGLIPHPHARTQSMSKVTGSGGRVKGLPFES
ncbi:Retrovirus-related Pol polyprotein from transposon TNT 1-94 Includes: RecName: Full=Protease; Includes: RecName: Full=Reverse transcriptase; Includes: RecName: Full=Endonuclease [Serendipita indica DSM 11827]|nr:Retrovirus-related Pol polyprotein from transposon TNT 1-94 Includes: RecName: Full=Protease; Includes: RecName: Full=Reverse transcriptase; Includes: RecName: Full=Endonuclease [Serendipita indica DSM 11827]